MLILHTLQFLFKAVLHSTSSIQVTGREQVPWHQPFLLVTNHVSRVDTPVIMTTIPNNPLPNGRYFAAHVWESHWFYGMMLKRTRAIFINREELDRGALKEAIDFIKEGGILGLAPEGTYNEHTRTMLRAKEGAAYLASRANVPLVPVALTNTDKWGANLRKLRRTPITVTFGEPFYLPDLGRRAKTKDLPAYTHYIMVKIANMLPKRYHGYYADSPALAALKRGEDPFPYCQEFEGKLLAEKK